MSVTGPCRNPCGGTFATWTLAWPGQLRAENPPLALHAHYGVGFHHPHLRGATVAEWPLNVSTPDQAAELLPSRTSPTGSSGLL